MTEKLYLADSYLKEFKAEVVLADQGLVLDKTAFYPASGGQPNDLGKLFHDGRGFEVVNVEKDCDRIVHTLNDVIEAGSEVTGRIDWDRRYRFMRYHTSMHLLSTIVLQRYNSFITGNQINSNKSRIDFNLRDYDKEELLGYVEERANKLIREGREVRTYFLDRDEALEIPFAKRLKTNSLPKTGKLRIVEIVGFDKEICGGTHVKNLSEIDGVKIIGLRSKGKENKRLEFTLLD